MDPDIAASIDRATHGSSDDPSLLDFSANVNPRTSSGVESVYTSAFDESRTYPPEPPVSFRQTAATYVGCEPNSVIPTAGGMAAIRLAIGIFVDAGDNVLIPTPSFSEYEREVRLHGGIPVFSDANSILDADPSEYAMVILCTPNNPTGYLPAREELLEFVENCRKEQTDVLIDEAFLDFTDQRSLAGERGVIVARSLTKMFGLPGIRVGFAVASDDKRDALEGARPPWNLSTPARAVGKYCLTQSTFISQTKRRIERERDRLTRKLREHYRITPSVAPFLLLEVPSRPVDDLIRDAFDRGIVVRDARTFRGLDAHVRVAIRMPAANDRLLEVLTDV